MDLDGMTPDGTTVGEKIERGLRPDWDYRYVPAITRQLHQGYFGKVSYEDIHGCESYPQDHVDMAMFLAGLPLVERLDSMLALHPEYDVELLDQLVRGSLCAVASNGFIADRTA